MTHDEVYDKVQEVLIDALGVDEEEVTPEATLVGDLGAESIDFLDIVFRLEKAFDIKIDQAELFPDKVLEDPTYVREGKITETGMEELKKRLAGETTRLRSRDAFLILEQILGGMFSSRLNVTASNLANAETTKTENGGPYLRRQVTFTAGRTEFDVFNEITAEVSLIGFTDFVPNDPQVVAGNLAPDLKEAIKAELASLSRGAGSDFIFNLVDATEFVPVSEDGQLTNADFDVIRAAIEEVEPIIAQCSNQ